MRLVSRPMRALALAIAVMLSPTLMPPALAACPSAQIDVCFRPGPASCSERIAAAINAARQSVLIQAYAFTSKPIAEAIAEARKRKVNVRALLDRENRSSRYSAADFIAHAGIPVRIDDQVGTAHNKVIVIDGRTVIGGSYNFTTAAEMKNAENVLFIDDRCTASRFTENFEERWRLSAPYKGK